MEIKEFIRLEDEVKQILIDYPEARNDDMFLYWTYCQNKFRDNGELIDSNTFVCLFISSKQRKDYNLRSYESVSRCRRKIQAQCPELASERAIRKLKKQQEQDFKEYARL